MNSQNKRIIVYLAVIAGIIALTVPTLHSQAAGGDQGEHFQRSFNLSSGGTLNVDNYKGTIHVTGSDTNQVVVDVTKHFEGSDANRKWWMENLHVNFRNSGDHVSVEVKYPQENCIFCFQGMNYEASVELEIRVPRQINVALDSYKPDIKIAAIQGDIRIKSYKSPIEIESTTGAINIDTYKDSIKLHNVTVHGPLEIKSYKADAEIDARSLGETATIENEKGSIVLRVPASAGVDINFEGGRRASFHSDFPMSSRSGNLDGSVRGTINQGGTRLRLHTERGSVSLEKLSGSF
jgi:hypothetical protein